MSIQKLKKVIDKLFFLCLNNFVHVLEGNGYERRLGQSPVVIFFRDGLFCVKKDFFYGRKTVFSFLRSREPSLCLERTVLKINS